MNVQNRSFLGALAAAIVSFCRLFIKAMNVAEDAVSMGEKSVKVAREKQAIDLAIQMKNYAQLARERAVMLEVKQEKAMREFIGNDPETKAMVEESRRTIDALIKKEIAELVATEED